MELSIIIINKDTPAITKNAVISVLNTIKNINFEVVVVDNSSFLGNVFRSFDDRVKVLDRIENKGFGNACNIGAKNSTGDVILFLNSDTILFENTVEKAYKYFKTIKKVGALGVRQLLKNGKLDAGCKRGFPTPMNSLYYFLGLSKMFPKSKRFGAYQQTFEREDGVFEVDCISGAFVMIYRSVFNFIGGFDEDYFLYGEDVDLCYRLKQIGFKNIYFGEVSFLHYKNESGKGSLKVLKSFYESMKIFYDKHYKKKYIFLIRWLVKFGINLKYFFAKRRFIKKYGKG